MTQQQQQLANKANNAMEKRNSNPTVKSLLSNEEYKNRFREVLKDKAEGFMSSMISAVSTNAALAQCNPTTVIMASLKAAVLDLPIEQNLGFAHLVPYKGQCQFQMGYKGFIQLALRSGQYQKINVIDVREGELVTWNGFTEDLQIEFIEDEIKRDKAKVVGYAAYFRLTNGFEKMVYMSAEKILSHAKKYSANFRATGKGLWRDDFDAMARKTLLKLLLGKWGILSTTMQLQEAVKADQAVINEDGQLDYIDSADIEVEEESEETGEVTVKTILDEISNLKNNKECDEYWGANMKIIASFSEADQAEIGIAIKKQKESFKK